MRHARRMARDGKGSGERKEETGTPGDKGKGGRKRQKYFEMEQRISNQDMKRTQERELIKTRFLEELQGERFRRVSKRKLQEESLNI